MSVHIVMPIGVGAPGTPVPELLEKSISSIVHQLPTTPGYSDATLTIAADSNIGEDAKYVLRNYSLLAKIKWFEPFSYFRKGGIWKKIFDVWKSSDAEFVAFMHYDDLWHCDKLRKQIDFIKANNLDGAWSEVYEIDGNDTVRGGDKACWNECSIGTVGQGAPAFAHSVLVRRNSILNCGILDYEDKWAANFETLFAIYMHKIKNAKKCPGAKFYWRNHGLNISNTASENSQFVQDQRDATSYTIQETLADADGIPLGKIIDEIKALY